MALHILKRSDPPPIQDALGIGYLTLRLDRLMVIENAITLLIVRVVTEAALPGLIILDRGDE